MAAIFARAAAALIVLGVVLAGGGTVAWSQGADELAALNAQVVKLYGLGKYAEAIEIAKRSLALAEKQLGPDHPDVGQSLNNLALLYDKQGRYGEAEPLYKRSLALSEKALGPDHPAVGTSLNNLAGLYESQGRYAEAEPLYKRSLAISEKTLGAEHPLVLRRATLVRIC